jgi:hypothetical protein
MEIIKLFSGLLVFRGILRWINDEPTDLMWTAAAQAAFRRRDAPSRRRAAARRDDLRWYPP